MTAARKKSTFGDRVYTVEELDSCPYLTISVAPAEGPYSAAIAHLFLGNTLYFYCEGTEKLCSLLEDHPEVCISGVLGMKPCEAGSLPQPETVLAFGTAERVDEPQEYRQVLFGMYNRQINPENKQEAWMFSRNEHWVVYKVKVSRISGN